MSDVIVYLKYGIGIYNCYFFIILFNMFMDNIINFVGFNGYYEYCFDFFVGRKKNNVYNNCKEIIN